MGDLVAHMDDDGIVYSHWLHENLSDSIGHVDKDGVVYSHWSREGTSDSVGRVEGGNIYAAGAALLLLKIHTQKPASAPSTPVDQDEWRTERVAHELEMERSRNRSKLKAAKMQNYRNNPKIVAAAKEYAQQRRSTATIFTIIFVILVTIGGFKDMAPEAIAPVVGIVGLFALIAVLFVRHMTYRDSFEKKFGNLENRVLVMMFPQRSKPKRSRRPSLSRNLWDPALYLAPTAVLSCAPLPVSEQSRLLAPIPIAKSNLRWIHKEKCYEAYL